MLVHVRQEMLLENHIKMLQEERKIRLPWYRIHLPSQLMHLSCDGSQLPSYMTSLPFHQDLSQIAKDLAILGLMGTLMRVPDLASIDANLRTNFNTSSALF